MVHNISLFIVMLITRSLTLMCRWYYKSNLQCPVSTQQCLIQCVRRLNQLFWSQVQMISLLDKCIFILVSFCHPNAGVNDVYRFTLVSPTPVSEELFTATVGCLIDSIECITLLNIFLNIYQHFVDSDRALLTIALPRCILNTTRKPHRDSYHISKGDNCCGLWYQKFLPNIFVLIYEWE